MTDIKTKKTRESAAGYIKAFPDDQKRRDCQLLMKMMHRATGKRAAMWGTSMVGYGKYHYKYASGREGDYFLTGFAPRAQNITVYIMPGFSQYKSELKALGKHKTGKSCLYLRSLEDVDLTILEKLIKDSVIEMKRIYPTAG